MSEHGTEQINPESLIIIQEPGFLAVVWTCVAVSFLFVCFRAYVRLRVFGRFHDDDVFVLLAWLILFTCTILWHVRRTLDLVYISFFVGYGAESPPPYYIEHLSNWLHILFAELLLNMLGIWSIKFSFLALFRKLSKDVHKERVLWWVVTALTIISLAVSIGVSYYPCIFPKGNDEEINMVSHTQGWSSDLQVVSYTVWMRFRIGFIEQKLGLLAVFCLVAVTMVFSLVRVIVGLRGQREDDVWFFLCATIELAISIIVACLVSYRSLYKAEKKSSNKSYSKFNTNTDGSGPSRKMRSNKSYDDDSYANVITSVNEHKDTSRGGETNTYLTSHSDGTAEDNGAEMIPLDIIDVESQARSNHPRGR